MTSNYKRLLSLSFVFSIFTFWCGYSFKSQGFEFSLQRDTLGVAITRDSLGAREVDLSLFWEVWDLLHEEYLQRDELDPKRLLYGAIAGLTGSLGDPYTAFLDPEENAAVRDGLNGQYEGIGAELGMRDGQLVIIAPLEGSPAAAVGVVAGDRVLEIEGEGTPGVTLSEAVSKIRGEAGTTVTLTLSREGGSSESFDKVITRGRITLESVQWRPLTEEGAPSLAYIRVSRFGERTVGEWQVAVNELAAASTEPLRGIILDLRNNPGGLLSASVQIASDFVDQGVVVIEEFSDGRRQNFRSTGSGRLVSVPVVVLLNQGSASASEILAAALSYQRDTPIVGEKSFGKGTVQDAQDLPGGSGVHITVARWLTPQGDCVDGEGIEPDFEVTISEEDREQGVDSPLEKAIELLGGR